MLVDLAFEVQVHVHEGAVLIVCLLGVSPLMQKSDSQALSVHGHKGYEHGVAMALLLMNSASRILLHTKNSIIARGRKHRPAACRCRFALPESRSSLKSIALPSSGPIFRLVCAVQLLTTAGLFWRLAAGFCGAGKVLFSFSHEFQ